MAKQSLLVPCLLLFCFAWQVVGQAQDAQCDPSDSTRPFGDDAAVRGPNSLFQAGSQRSTRGVSDDHKAAQKEDPCDDLEQVSQRDLCKNRLQDVIPPRMIDGDTWNKYWDFKQGNTGGYVFWKLEDNGKDLFWVMHEMVKGFSDTWMKDVIDKLPKDGHWYISFTKPFWGTTIVQWGKASDVSLADKLPMFLGNLIKYPGEPVWPAGPYTAKEEVHNHLLWFKVGYGMK